MVYALSGINDTTYAYSPFSRAISISYASGDKSSVQLSISGLPEGLQGHFADTGGLYRHRRKC